MTLDAFVAAVAHGRWHPGIGDPTPVGWLTVAAYLLAALLCWRAAARAGSRFGPERDRRAFWLGLAWLLVLLGVNKQLDLQTWLTQTGRDLARAQGWYASRRAVQEFFIAFVATAGMLSVAVCFWWLGARLRRIGLAAVGAAFLVVFIVCRAASFHHMDALLAVRFLGTRANAWLELAGIALIGAGALRYAAWARRARAGIFRRGGVIHARRPRPEGSAVGPRVRPPGH